MSHSARIAALATDEHGAVLVIFAVFAPVAVLLAVFAIEASNWFLHDRHLQVQADAGVLAAAQQFQNCFSNTTKANEEIKAVAERYSGVGAGTPYNEQVGKTSQHTPQVHELVNSKKYFNAPSNPVSNDSSVVEQPPCEASMVDLKVTESSLPWYWHPLSSVRYLNAHARVEILQQNTATGVEPLAVADTAPVAVRAYFVDEDNNNAVLAQVPLEKTEANAQGQDVWSNPKAPAAVTINHRHIGVVIALSGNKSETTCGHEYVECFGRKSANEKATIESAEPALQIAGYPKSGTGTPAEPIVREQRLTPSTCTDGYFSAAGESCKFNISAKVDYGSAKTQGMTVTPEINGVAGAALTPPKTNGQTEAWTGSATLPANTGSNEIRLKVKCKAEALSPCPAKSTEPTVKNVHRIFAAGNVHSGSIAGAWIGVSAGTPQDADTFEECATCTQKLIVTVDVEGSLSAATGYGDPLRQLKFEGNHGVIVGCPPGVAGESASEFREHLEKGCPGTYKINASNPACTVNTEPYDCLEVNANGKKAGAMKGFEKRIESTPGRTFYCPNKWQNTNNGGIPELPADDSRIVQVFIMPFGSLNSKGEAVLASGEVQIQDFAAFYVTGFPNDSCKSDPSTGNAEVVGHFIKYISLVATEGGGKPKCREDPLGECVAVLTR